MLLLCILFSTIIFVGCSTVIIGPSGSIEITTNPSGAKIFLDGKDTGKITPYTLKNISVGSHIIEVTLSDMKCTKIAKVTTYQTTNINIEFYSQITLNKINVLPSTTNITLSLGSTVTVSSVTAYYSDYSSANIPLVNCNYSSNDACATINSSGTITGISAGAAIITPPVQDDIVYRALLVGVGDYENNDGVTLTDLDGPPYDVDRIIQVLNQCKFGSDEIGFSLIEPLKDLSATKEAIINGIASTFSGADDNDISYFYFSGHGSYTGVFENSYILPTDVDGSIDSAISVDELEIALSAILGTKVVIFDSCFSGGFIGKGKGEIIISREKLTSFNDEIINIFSQVQSKGLLTTNKYKVLTSCHYNQPCVEYSTHPVDGNPYGLFTAAFCKGCGYDDGTYYADSDNNTKVSLQEAYSYIESTLILSEQDVQVYPTNSTFTIAEY
jgi:hypothetical protein